jgi:hypothetical protein
MTTRKAVAILVCAMMLSSVGPLSAFAWEKDVHYGLTKWLALSAGFSDPDAERIAAADQGLDDGHFSSAVWAVLFHLIMDGDAEASRQIQTWHFPSDADVPSDPLSRKVVHDSRAARREAERIIAQPSSAEPDEAMLRDFGQALHPFQDSWSHEGTPDTPFRPIISIREQLTWGHPMDRGGWDSHDADLTYLHVDQTVEMAKLSFELIEQLLAKHSNLRHSPSHEWTQMESDIHDFAAKDTKSGKANWFSGHGLHSGAVEIASQCDLPDGVSGLASATDIGRTDSLSENAASESFGDASPGLRMVADFEMNFWRPESIPTDLNFKNAYRSDLPSSSGKWVARVWSRSPDLGRENEFARPIMDTVDSFCEKWISEQDIAAASRLVDLSELGTELKSFHGEESGDWLSRFLTLWLVEDHGLVNRLGHGNPMTKGYQRLPFRSVSEGPLRTLPRGPLFGTIQTGLVPPIFYQIVEAQPGWMGIDEPFAVLIHFTHTPHDALILVLTREGDGWKIVRMFPLVG